jgi:hypothetical protein
MLVVGQSEANIYVELMLLMCLSLTWFQFDGSFCIHNDGLIEVLAFRFLAVLLKAVSSFVT